MDDIFEGDINLKLTSLEATRLVMMLKELSKGIELEAMEKNGSLTVFEDLDIDICAKVAGQVMCQSDNLNVEQVQSEILELQQKEQSRKQEILKINHQARNN